MVTGIVTGQLWSLTTTTIQVRLRIQLNSALFAKTLVRKDVASSSPSNPPSVVGASAADKDKEKSKADEDDFSSKGQIMTLMTTDVDRVSEFAFHVFSLIGALSFRDVLVLLPTPLWMLFKDSPIEIVIGTFFLYTLLGASSSLR